MKTIHHIAEVLGLEKNELLPYGHYMGKVDFRANQWSFGLDNQSVGHV